MGRAFLILLASPQVTALHALRRPFGQIFDKLL